MPSPERLDAGEADLNARAVEQFARAVGGRDKLTRVLMVGGSDASRIIDLLLDPRYETWSLKKLCRLAGITVADLFVAYQKALITRAHIKATHKIARKLPAIVGDVMDRALPKQVRCPDCHGDAGLRADCETCAGTGVQDVEPPLDRQKLALELGQLTHKSAGIVIQNNAVATAAALSATGAGALEQLQQAVGDLLFTPARGTLDVDPTPADPSVDPEVINPPDEDDREPEPDDDDGDVDDGDGDGDGGGDKEDAAPTSG